MGHLATAAARLAASLYNSLSLHTMEPQAAPLVNLRGLTGRIKGILELKTRRPLLMLLHL